MSRNSHRIVSCVPTLLGPVGDPLSRKYPGPGHAFTLRLVRATMTDIKTIAPIGPDMN